MLFIATKHQNKESNGKANWNDKLKLSNAEILAFNYACKLHHSLTYLGLVNPTATVRFLYFIHNAVYWCISDALDDITRDEIEIYSSQQWENVKIEQHLVKS